MKLSFVEHVLYTRRQTLVIYTLHAWSFDEMETQRVLSQGLNPEKRDQKSRSTGIFVLCLCGEEMLGRWGGRAPGLCPVFAKGLYRLPRKISKGTWSTTRTVSMILHSLSPNTSG